MAGMFERIQRTARGQPVGGSPAQAIEDLGPNESYDFFTGQTKPKEQGLWDRLIELFRLKKFRPDYEQIEIEDRWQRERGRHPTYDELQKELAKVQNSPHRKRW